MPRETPWADEYTLLCERCGYVIEGLATDGACPECGKPISESLPERRVGTPWQQRPSFVNLLRTWWMTLRHPKRTLDVMAFDDGGGDRLMQITCLVGLVLWPVLFSLTRIEMRGLQLFGKQRGERITRSIAGTVCAHGAAGWVVSMLGLGFGLVLAAIGYGLSLEVDRLPAGQYDPFIASALVGLGLGAGSGIALGGFLFFEWFAWLGLRRCKYANRARPGTGASNPRAADS